LFNISTYKEGCASYTDPLLSCRRNKMCTCLGWRNHGIWHATFKENSKERRPTSWLRSLTVILRWKCRKSRKRSGTNDGEAAASRVPEKHYQRARLPETAVSQVKSNDLHKSRSGDIHLDESQRTELTEMLDESLSSDITRPIEVVCDGLLWHVDGTTRLRRRFFLDPKTWVNVMADDVRQDLGEELGTYNGPPVCVNGQYDVRPLGKIKTKWELPKGNRVYEDLFLVIESDAFDVLLGKESILDHMLYRTIPSLARQLRESVS